jgi:hypothetical protein
MLRRHVTAMQKIVEENRERGKQRPPTDSNGHYHSSRLNVRMIQELHEDSYSTEVLNALIILAIRDAIAGEESSCRKCFP